MKSSEGFLQSFKEFVEGNKSDKQIPRLRMLWETCQRSDFMLWALDKIGFNDDKLLRLFACACVRKTPVLGGCTVWAFLTDNRSRAAVEAAERYAKGEISEVDNDGAWEDAMDVIWVAGWEDSGAPHWNIAQDNKRVAAREAARNVTEKNALCAAVGAAWGAARASGTKTAKKFQADLLRSMIPWSTIENKISLEGMPL